MTIPTDPALNEEWTNDVTGITYTWSGERWLILDDSNYEDLVRQDEFEEDQARQDEEIAKLTGLAVDRRVYRYAGVDATPNSGQFSSNSNVVASITQLSFGVRDQNDDLTPIKAVGDQVTLTGESTRTTFIITGLDRIEGVYTVSPVTNSGTLENSETYLAAFGVDTSALSARVLVGEVKQEAISLAVEEGIDKQSEIIDDINTLENKVSALEGSLVDGRWSFESDNRLPTRGEFALRASGVVSSSWEAATSLIVNEIDYDGKTFTFANISVGDVLRLGAPDTSGAEYRITEVTGTGVFNISYIFGAGAPDDEVVYGFSFLSAFDPAGLASIEYVDAQDDLKLNLTGGTITGDLRFKGNDGTDGLSIFSGTQGNNQVVTLNNGITRFRSSSNNSNTTGLNTHLTFGRTVEGTPQTNIYHVQYPEQPNWAANKQYVDDQVADVDLSGYLPLTGGELSGDLDLDGGHLYVSQGDNTNFVVETSGFCRTNDIFRSDRGDNGPCFQARDSGDTKFQVRSNGNTEIYGFTTFYEHATLRNGMRLRVRGPGNTDVGYFMATDNNQCQLGAYSGKTLNIKNLNAPSDNLDAVPKIYVDSAIAPFQTAEDVQNAIDAETVHLTKSGDVMANSSYLEFPGGGIKFSNIRTIASSSQCKS